MAGARPPNTPTLARIPEYGLRALEDSGLSLPQAATVIYTAVHYTFGHVIEEQDSADAQLTKEFERAYPTVARTMTEGRRAGLTATDVFDAGLSLIIGKQ
ncbi:TetR/AcrR family transcriptional regulator C-terminal domain-containing protein [Nonomuraea fuscirosea]|uniref:TetR/AcrR family transcriptional regulator C-terminal domain-containing protein n=1 Tax=Nonomuraea fuscirosea TaxID=1291556 RepID=UPI0033C6B80A